MKKTLIIGLLGLAGSMATSFGQGFIALDNYSTYGPLVTYGAGSGGPVGTGLPAGWTAGLYVAQGNILGSIGSNTSGNGDVQSDLSSSFVLGTGTGSTAGIAAANVGGALGEFQATSGFQASASGGATVTVVVVAYNGGTYAGSLIRGHSAAFVMTANAGTSVPFVVGSGMTSFSVTPIPEPTTFALAGFGAAAMLILRRRQA